MAVYGGTKCSLKKKAIGCIPRFNCMYAFGNIVEVVLNWRHSSSVLSHKVEWLEV